MKKITTISLAAAVSLLAGCSSSSDGISNTDPRNFPQNLDEFSLEPYREASELLSTSELKGTWVGVRELIYTDANSSGYDYKRYESRLEFLIIRDGSDSDSGYEIASCNAGGFLDIRSFSSSNVATVGLGTFNRDSDNVLTQTVFDEPVATGVSLTTRVEYIRLREATSAVGTMQWDWESVDDPVTNQNIFCAAIHHLEKEDDAPDGTGYKIALATTGEKDAVLQISDTSYPFTALDVYFNDEINALAHRAENVSDEIVLNIAEETDNGFQVNFSIFSSDTNDDTVVGSFNVNVDF